MQSSQQFIERVKHATRTEDKLLRTMDKRAKARRVQSMEHEMEVYRRAFLESHIKNRHLAEKIP